MKRSYSNCGKIRSGAAAFMVAVAVLFLISCATIPKEKDIVDMKLIQRVVTTDGVGNVLYIQDTLEPAVPFNFWSTLLSVGVGAVKKQGGL